MSLECIRICTRFKNASAQRRRATRNDFARDAQHLLARFHRARPGDHRARPRANFEGPDLVHRRRLAGGRVRQRFHHRLGALTGRHHPRRVRRRLAEGNDLHVAHRGQRLQPRGIRPEHPHPNRELRVAGQRQERGAGQHVEPSGRGHARSPQKSERHLRARVIRHAQVHEARAVLLLVGDVVDQHFQPVPLGGAPRADGGVGRRLVRDDLRRARGVVADDALDPHLRQPVRALSQRGRMRPRALHFVQRRPRPRRQREPHRHAGEPDRNQIRPIDHELRERLQRLGDRADDRVLHRQHGFVDQAVAQRLQQLLETGKPLGNAAVRRCRHFTVSARLALVPDPDFLDGLLCRIASFDFTQHHRSASKGQISACRR